MFNNEFKIAVVNDKRFAVEERNGNMSFNLTQMAKPFGVSKRPNQWLRSQPAKEYLDEMTKVLKSSLADLVEVRKGGTPDLAGTWANDYRVAVEFARWLDPRFSIAVNDLIFRIITKQVTIASAPEKYGVKALVYDRNVLYSYMDSMKSLGGSTKSSASRRKKRYPNHFVMIGGRNYITGEYLDLLHGFYAYRNAQLSLSFAD